jgi:hypothetical protein
MPRGRTIHSVFFNPGDPKERIPGFVFQGIMNPEAKKPKTRKGSEARWKTII